MTRPTESGLGMLGHRAMTMPVGSCPRCSGPVSKVRLDGETTIITEDGDVRAAKRDFVGECREHGTVLVLWTMGHHSTLGEKEVRRRYGKLAYRRLVRLLPRTDKARFIRAFHGKHRPTAEDVACWDRHALAPQVPKVASWIGGAETKEGGGDA